MPGSPSSWSTIADRLQTIHDDLPASPNRDAMLEHRVPRDAAVYVVTAAGVEALREGAAAFDSEREAATAEVPEQPLDATPIAQD